MNLTNVQTFLKVAYSSSLTQAANELYVSQPTVTSRLQQLETELDTVLLRRGKGVRSIELTPQGRAFVPLAERWVALETETMQFQTQQVQLPLSIACLDSINRYILAPLFRQLTRENPDLRMNIRTHQSYEIFSLVENHEVDFGFAYILSRYNNVNCEALFSEKMAVLGSKRHFGADQIIEPRQLDPELEIYVPWSQEFVLWHNDWWDPRVAPLVQTDLASMIPLYLDHPGSWAICPYSAARAFLQERDDLQVLQLSCEIPRRICYLLRSKNSRWTEPAAAEVFRETLQTYLEQATWLDKI